MTYSPTLLQELQVVSKLFPLISTGEKTNTIRWRETPMVPGPMRLICQERPSDSIVVQVTRCTDMPLREAASFLGKTDEWPDEIMLSGMREHYPEIELTSIVQVVEFTV